MNRYLPRRDRPEDFHELKDEEIQDRVAQAEYNREQELDYQREKSQGIT
jgi:hypothetical protein